MPWQNFSIWHGRLPHWRAEAVTYYVTFRHRRPLEEAERRLLLGNLLKPLGKQWDVLILCVLPEKTELIFKVLESPKGEVYELSDIVEKAKARTAKEIQKRTDERFSPFYGESYDRILRDDAELQTFWDAIIESPVQLELVEDPEEYETLWVSALE